MSFFEIARGGFLPFGANGLKPRCRSALACALTEEMERPGNLSLCACHRMKVPASSASFITSSSLLMSSGGHLWRSLELNCSLTLDSTATSKWTSLMVMQWVGRLVLTYLRFPGTVQLLVA